MIEKKVIVEYAEKWTSGGIESYILNLVKRLDREKFIVRIVVAQKETDIYDEELKKYNTTVECILQNVYENPIIRMIENRKFFAKYFSEHQCDVLHLHICQGVALGYAKMAKKIGIPKVISHCHNTDFGDGNRFIKSLGHKLGKIVYAKYPDVYIACSDLAAVWLYPKKILEQVIISKYIVEVDNFLFSEVDRREIRNRYDLDDKTQVFLNIGRLHYQKNQLFLLNVFKKYHYDIDKTAKLIIIGTGELEDNIYTFVNKNELTEVVIFVPKTREVNKFMSASDFFLLPSLYEGNPVVGTEAQANGLPCLFADTITKSASVLASSCFIPISCMDDWVDAMKKIKNNSVDDRKASLGIMKNAGYDVGHQIVSMEQIYENQP